MPPGFDAAAALREWADAERVAIEAEEILRKSLRDHIDCRRPEPPPAFRALVAGLRARADALFAALDDSLGGDQLQNQDHEVI